MLAARAVSGGSGYGSAKFEAVNSERYHWLEDVKDAQGRRLGEPGTLADLHFSAFIESFHRIRLSHTFCSERCLKEVHAF
jgi:hypothetical protein